MLTNTPEQLAAEGDGGIPLRRVPRVLLTLEEVKQVTRRLLEQPHFVFDVETTSLNPRTNELLWIGLAAASQVYLIPCRHPKGVQISPERKEKVAACILYPESDERHWTPVKHEPSMKMVERTVPAVYARPPGQLFAHEVMAALRPLMFSDRGKIGHNVKFDLQSVAKYYDGEIPPPPYHDTILVRHTLVEDLGDYDLKTLVCNWFNVPPSRRAKFYPNLGKLGVDNFGLDEVARYLAKDVRYCWLMFERFYPLLVRRKLKSVYDFEMEVYPIIMQMEQTGFAVDLSQMDRVRQDLQGKLVEVEKKCYRLAGDEFSLSNTDAKRWVLFGEGIPEYGKSKRQLRSQNLRVRTRTPKNQHPAVTAAVLEYYSDKGNEMATLLAEWAGLEKLRGTFIEGLNGFLNHHQDGPPTIHTGYRQHGTVTGRLSSASPNLQQLPRGSTIRDLFVAPTGKVLVVADYDQIELRCAGYLSGDTNMLQVFKEGRDIHAQAAAAMFGVPVEAVTDDMRMVGKTQNFAVLYGAGEGKIAQVAGCSTERASRLIRGYFQAFPALEEWKAKELQRARKRGDRAAPDVRPPHVVIPPNGRVRRLPDLFELQDSWIRSRAERQAINAIVQGFASNITKLAMLALHETLFPFAQMLAQVHDEIVLQTDEQRARRVLSQVKSIMGSITDPQTGNPILGEIPLVASAAIGSSWAQAKQNAK